MTDQSSLSTYPHAGVLKDIATLPTYLSLKHEPGHPPNGRYSCCFCGVGDSGLILVDDPSKKDASTNNTIKLPIASGLFTYQVNEEVKEYPIEIKDHSRIELSTKTPLCPKKGVIHGKCLIDGNLIPLTAREVSREPLETDGVLQTFVPYQRAGSVTSNPIKKTTPTSGCVKLQLSTGRQKPAFPIHAIPSILKGTARQNISYKESIKLLAKQVLDHRLNRGQILVYASGQLDYFTIFAMQEVFRLLGVRNLTGNAEHCLNAGAVHNEVLTGQEGPFLTIEQGIKGPNRLFFLNGWNGFITHPPVFHSITKRPDFDGYLIDVMVTESAKAVAQKLGPDRVLLIRPKTDPHLALAIAHEILKRYSDRIEQRFIDQYSNTSSFKLFRNFALSPQFAADKVAERIAPEPQYVNRLLKAIRSIAFKLVEEDSVPINIPSVGLSQTSGVVAHCLWGNLMGMLGKYGLNADGTPAGGTLRVPGQINAESEVQGLSRKYFFGRILIKDRADAAQRMNLPIDAYDEVEADLPRAVLDYLKPTEGRELFLCFGTQFEANMMARPQWLKKLEDPKNTLVVVDPIPDPYSLENSELIIPSPPHSATTKVYQNGEWKLSLSVPQKQAPKESRSDATIIYDLMEEITRLVVEDPSVAQANPDLKTHADSGYLQARFCTPKGKGQPGLSRLENEVSRVELWDRIQEYMSGGCGPLYCRPEHADGRLIQWSELLEDSIVYGGCGTTRFKLDYDNPNAVPFQDIYRRPGKFKFFVPTQHDLTFPTGLILNSGRSTLSDDPVKVRFATSTFNSGKATPLTNMPDENPLHISPMVAQNFALNTGDYVKVIGLDTKESMLFPVVVTDRVKGETLYISFHKSKAKLERNETVNHVTSSIGRCAYSGQTQVKATQIQLEKVPLPDRVAKGRLLESLKVVSGPRLDTTDIDHRGELPIWSGESTPLYITEIIEETHDAYTYRFQGKPLCRFVYKPGQYCTLLLNINGKKVIRSYTISSSPSRPYSLEITVKRVPGGLVSNWLPDHLKVGDRVTIAGPRGKFHLEPGKIPPKLLLVGAGSGVTPMISMARWLCDISADVDVRFFYSARSSNDIIFEDEIRYLTTRHQQFAPIVITSTRGRGGSWTGMMGRINSQMLMMAAPDLLEREVYTCGPEGFMEALKGILKGVNFDMSKFHMESFGGVRSAAGKPAKSLPTSSQSTSKIMVEFAKAGKSALSEENMTLLELAEENGIEIDYSCRMGSCGDCKCKLLSGKVEMDSEDGLEEDEKKDGYILTCVATPLEKCVLDT